MVAGGRPRQSSILRKLARLRGKFSLKVEALVGVELAVIAFGDYLSKAGSALPIHSRFSLRLWEIRALGHFSGFLSGFLDSFGFLCCIVMKTSRLSM